MITVLRFTLIIIFFLNFLISCEKKRKADFLIDPSISKVVDKKIQPFLQKANSNIIFTIIENDIKEINGDVNGEAALAFTSIIDNEVSIECLNGIEDGFGFSLIITRDTLIIKLKVMSGDSKIQFRTLYNKILQSDILVNCSKTNLILASQPKFKNDEIIEGKLELESEPFYENIVGKERKLKFKLLVFFRSEPIQGTKMGYKTLQKN